MVRGAIPVPGKSRIGWGWSCISLPGNRVFGKPIPGIVRPLIYAMVTIYNLVTGKNLGKAVANTVYGAIKWARYLVVCTVERIRWPVL